MQELLADLRSGRTCYTTDLGAQILGDSIKLLEQLPADSVDLFVTSPPFPLLRKKAYGNKDQQQYVAWLVSFAELAKTALKESGSLVIDMGGAYQAGAPVRSLHQFRALLAFVDKLGFFLAEEFYWYNPAKLPSPIEWVNKRKMRAKDSVNTIWWLSKDERPKADVGRVRVPYSRAMQDLLKRENYYTAKGRPSEHQIGNAFRIDNGGALPSNFLVMPDLEELLSKPAVVDLLGDSANVVSLANSQSNDSYHRFVNSLGFKGHPARFPLKLPEFFIEMLTDPGDLVVDFFGGSNTTGRVAEDLGRRWLTFELEQDYAALSAVRFMDGCDVEVVRSVVERIKDGETISLSPENVTRMSFGVEEDRPAAQSEVETEL